MVLPFVTGNIPSFRLGSVIPAKAGIQSVLRHSREGGNPILGPCLRDIDGRIDGVKCGAHGIRVMTARGVQQGVDGLAEHS